ncbi:trypsin-like serine protease [Kitasatospora aureofaciens]|uniref:trypsin-like serine protease n=1 Tax=Kitasatospora aureofaciens TaxID=1894 RepID=UPI0033C0DE97
MRTVRRLAWPLGAALAVPVMAAPMPTAAADAAPPSAVEGFAYPDAAKIRADQHITLKTGDGHITLAECSSAGGLVHLFSRPADPIHPVEPDEVCFKVTGPTGYLALEIPRVYLIRGTEHAIKATVSTDSNATTIDIPKNDWRAVGEAGSSRDATILLELTATDGPTAPAASDDFPAVGTVTMDQPGRSANAKACTATLVNRYWVLTAASCFGDKPAAGAPAAKSTATIAGRTVDIVELAPRADRDLVMARLAVPLSGVTPAVVDTTAPTGGENLRVAGYGRTAAEWKPLKAHVTTHAVSTITATTIDTAPASGQAPICQGDAGAPLLRDKNGSTQIAAVASRSWQGGCLGTPTTETRTSAVNTRTDDLAGWIQNTVAAWNVKVDYSSAVVNSVYNPDTRTAEIFALGTDGVLAHNSKKEDQGWSGWSTLQEWKFSGIPSTIYNPATKQLELFAVGQDGKLCRNHWDPAANKWMGWSVLPGITNLKANPVAVYNPSNRTAEVFALTTDSYMTHSYSADGAPWDDVRLHGNWQFAGTPTTVYNPSTDAVELFATTSRNELGHRYWDNKAKSWSDWGTIGGQAVAGSPTAVVNPANNSAEVFVTTTNGTMAHAYSGNGSPWNSLSTMGDWQFNGTPTAVFNPAANAVELFAVGSTNGKLGHNYWDNKTKAWGGWGTISDWQFSGTPSATYNAYTNTLELFATGTNGTMSRATYKDNKWLTWETMPGWTFAITG